MVSVDVKHHVYLLGTLSLSLCACACVDLCRCFDLHFLFLFLFLFFVFVGRMWRTRYVQELHEYVEQLFVFCGRTDATGNQGLNVGPSNNRTVISPRCES